MIAGRCRRLLLLPTQYMIRVLLFLMGYMYIEEKGCCPLVSKWALHLPRYSVTAFLMIPTTAFIT